MSEPKIENGPFERLNFDIFGTLGETFPKFWSIFPKFWSIFSKFWLIFTKILVKISGNRDPLRRKFLDFGTLSETDL